MNDEILQQLKDIHWPPPPSIWPLAIGYYLVLIVLAILISCLVYFLIWGRRRRRIRKMLNDELALIERNYQDVGDNALLQSSLSALVRRIIFWRRGDMAVKKSDDFSHMQEAMNKIFTNREKTQRMVTLLEKDRFHKSPEIDGDELIQLVREQIKRCRI